MDILNEAGVLLVDDTLTTLRQLADLLRSSGYEVDEASSPDLALEIMKEKGAKISFVLVDQVLRGIVDGGTKIAARLSKLRPDVFIVMYTADAQIDDVRRWEALNAGAHRYIRKSSARELLRDVGEFIDDMKELKDLTRQIDEIAEARRSMFSVLLGLDVRLSIIDREYRVWFTNREQGEGKNIRGIRCWTLFHGHSTGHGPCFGCLIHKVIETGKSQARILASPLESGELEWVRHDATPVRRSTTSQDGRIIAVRATTQKIEHSVLTLDSKERLSMLANSIVHQGYGRARIYRATGQERIRCEAVATRYSGEEEAAYRDAALGFETDTTQNIYMRRALEEVHGTLVEQVDTEYGLDPSSQMNIGQEAPWIDLPVWRDQELIGWLSVDTVGLLGRRLGHEDLEKLKPFKEEIERTLVGQVEGMGMNGKSRQILAEARSALVSVRGEGEALDHILSYTSKLVGNVARVLDVRVRVKQDGQLRLLKRLNPDARPTEEIISESNPHSLVAYVVRFGNDLFKDSEEYEQAGPGVKRLPSGLVPKSPNALAILRAKFEEQTFGTLHVECVGPISWELLGLREPLKELAKMTALLLRDIAQNQKLEKAREAAEKQWAQAFGAIHGVKGPVQACRNFLGTIRILHLQKKLTPKKAAELAQKAEFGLARIERLAVRLLRLVREPGIDNKQVDLREVLECCISDAKLLYPKLRLVYKIDESVESISSEEAELGVVIDELIMNSARARASTINIAVAAVDDRVLITVEDDGVGVPGEEELVKIFDRWYHTFAGGAGLGLAFVKKAIEDIGGEVSAERISPGLRIVMTLPKVQGSSSGSAGVAVEV